MSWPDWVEELKARYLADDGNVFLLHGAIGARFTVGGEALHLAEVLTRFLAPTRQVVGVLRPGEPLAFPNLGDVGRFERLLSAREIVLGRRLSREQENPDQALGLVWAALMGTGWDQGWIVLDVQGLLPAHRKRVEPLGNDAPPLWAWAEALQRSNDIVVLVASDASEVRQELVDSAVVIEVAAPEPTARPAPVGATLPPEMFSAPAPDPAGDARSAAEAEIAAFLAGRADAAPTREEPTSDVPPAPEPATTPPPVAPPTPSPAPTRAAAPADPTTEDAPGPSVEELVEALERALSETLTLRPVSTWTSRLPVMDAVARVLADLDDRVGLLELSADEDGRPVAEGFGADWFLARWQGDVALDAAAGMLLKEVPVPDGATHVTGPTPLDPIALRALAKRLHRLLRNR